MRLAMVIGEQRLALEQRMLNRLAVGLMAEGIHVARIVPEGWPPALLGEGERRMGLTPRFEARMNSMRWTRAAHVRRIADALQGNPPDVLYLLGRDAWSFGLELAADLDRPAVLEAWSASQAQSLPRPAAQPHMLAVTAPCEGIAKIVRSRAGAELTSVVPMGVSSPRRFAPVLSDSERPPAAAVIGGCRDVAAYSAMLHGLARVLKDHPSLQVFMELRGPHEHDIWRLAEKAGMINAVSAIGSASQHHALLTRCDLVLWPEQFGELRSVMLEAMSMAIAVIAAADPALDMLADGVTARLVQRPSATDWEHAVAGLLDNPSQAQALGHAGRERVLVQHRSSDQVDRLVDLLQRLVGKDAYAFPSPGE